MARGIYKIFNLYIVTITLSYFVQDNDNNKIYNISYNVYVRMYRSTPI